MLQTLDKEQKIMSALPNPDWRFEDHCEVLEPDPITTEKEYRHTLETVAGLQIALDDYRERGGHHLDPRMRQAVMEGMQSLIDEWGGQARDYEALKNGSVSLSLSSLRDLPNLLVRARIASKMTQKQLAEKLGLKAQQIQRWESTRYRTLTMERMFQIAEALGLKLDSPVSISR